MSKTSIDIAPQRLPRRRDSPNLLDEIQDETINPDEIVTEAPKGQFRLGYLDLTCLVLNHVMGRSAPDNLPIVSHDQPQFQLLTASRSKGTGIFNSPRRVIAGTNSTGAALLLWVLGIIVGLCSVHVYVEYGLSVPRYVIEGVEQTVPRSGGDLHYVSRDVPSQSRLSRLTPPQLHYVYRKPRYGKDTVLFLPCLYGIAFICLGNMAGNSVAFADRVLKASDPDRTPDDAAVRGVAIATATLTCFIHTVSRRGGIILNNVFAIVKIG